tara:strand:- start:2305 stop:2865 length:561 start_codon:yes stop_codon:yes gene_type:complete
MTMITEGLNYLDLENQMLPRFTIDEYAAKMGDDDEIVTVTFTVKSELAANDLVSWFERGYNFVLDASVSEGELEPGKHLVFVEMDRRSWSGKAIFNLIKDLQTLTGIAPKDWTMEIDDEEYPCQEALVIDKMILNPGKYREEVEEVEDEVDVELNEYRLRAGLEHQSTKLENKDTYIKDIQAAAGI